MQSFSGAPGATRSQELFKVRQQECIVVDWWEEEEVIEYGCTRRHSKYSSIRWHFPSHFNIIFTLHIN
jgi:hypothetical protein